MGRKSTKENKSIYQMAREEANLTREAASEKMGYISADRLERIESGKAVPQPSEVITMGECYKAPMLCNRYCTHECSIGKLCVREIEMKDLSKITLEMLASINSLYRQRERLIDITVDGVIEEAEMKDFKEIKETLGKMSIAIDSLKMWVNNAIANGTMKGE